MNKTYCIAATNRSTKKREDISGEIKTKAEADVRIGVLNLTWKRTHRYFKIAEFPYKHEQRKLRPGTYKPNSESEW